MTGSDCTVVCCIESGALEPMTLRLVESLRRFGGRLGECPVIAVTPRPGPPLKRSTREQLTRLDVESVRLTGSDPYPWYHFLNKARALRAIEDRLSTELIAFIDSDALVVAEPRQLLLDSAVDFVAKPEAGSIETTGEGDSYEPLWAAFAATLGIELSALPWVELPETRQSVRFYVNSGVFAYRRECRLAATYLDNALRLLDAGIACRRSGIHWIEQAALGLSVIQRGLRWRPLTAGYNFSLTAWGKGFRGLEAPADTRVLHYHNSMQSESWPAFLTWLSGPFPEVHDWLRHEGPIRDSARPHHRLESRIRRFWWSHRRRRFLADCRTL